MRLIDLKPRWVGLNPSQWGELEGPSVRFGLSFKCPHCEDRLAVMFKPFIDPTNFAERITWALPGAPNPNTGEVKEIHWWRRTGETFDTLTLTPSIDAANHWHGFITDGEIR